MLNKLKDLSEYLILLGTLFDSMMLVKIAVVLRLFVLAYEFYQKLNDK